MKLKPQTVCMSPEVAAALREAQSVFQSALEALPKSEQIDAMTGSIPRHPICGEENASSVKQRHRPGTGHAAHEVLAGLNAEPAVLEGLPRSPSENAMEGFFLSGGGFTAGGMASTTGGGGSYLDRRLLSYYLEGMSENQHFLETIDFNRREEHWDGRYNFDFENRNELVMREAQDDRDWEYQNSMDRAASNFASELQHTSDLYASDDYARRQALDDHYRYNSR